MGSVTSDGEERLTLNTRNEPILSMTLENMYPDLRNLKPGQLLAAATDIGFSHNGIKTLIKTNEIGIFLGYDIESPKHSIKKGIRYVYIKVMFKQKNLRMFMGSINTQLPKDIGESVYYLTNFYLINS